MHLAPAQWVALAAVLTMGAFTAFPEPGRHQTNEARATVGQVAGALVAVATAGMMAQYKVGTGLAVWITLAFVACASVAYLTTLGCGFSYEGCSRWARAYGLTSLNLMAGAAIYLGYLLAATWGWALGWRVVAACCACFLATSLMTVPMLLMGRRRAVQQTSAPPSG